MKFYIDPSSIGPTGDTRPTEIQSSFRATTAVGTNQPEVTPVIPTFDVVEFDLNGEYDGISTFTPKQDGVYLIIGSVTFSPGFVSIYTTTVNILVNGNIATTLPFMNGSTSVLNFTIISSILQLQAGDAVTIQAVTSITGVYVPNTGTHFEAARFPSP
ncbi:exosporium leader peptide [Bacillus cereus group sp. TH160LC]|uniref:exosporium leader peptide n=1 Tax=Bacillus cereus group sp. TH160LC TaxID=3018058 RepID=UPI0022E6102E|nr:exosporium leader peptide [Bacillus cereus group sp. TH160LC]MDA1650447.1 exosporium leader peptide [Bacillus cereus group sp. TH160LC]